MTYSKNFTIIKGGRKAPDTGHSHLFLSGYATDTRLMGVVGLFLSWEVISGAHTHRLYQLFYLDYEENIIDSYYESTDDTDAGFFNEKSRMLAALGGRPADISEKEARFLIQSCCISSADRTVKSTADRRYDFLLRPVSELSADEYSGLMSRLCVRIDSPYYAVNYYLMRSASSDLRGMACLCENSCFAEEPIRPSDVPELSVSVPFSGKQPMTFCMNTIDEKLDGSRYICRALTERSDSYYLSSVELTLASHTHKVLDAALISEFRISDIEAAMLLRRAEYIDVFAVLSNDVRFQQIFSAFTVHCTENIYSSGRLYVEFNDNNNHVGKEHYRLNDDVKTAYFLSSSGQLIMMAYSREAAAAAENRISMYFSSCGIIFGMQYEFHDPVFYEFISSGCDDFLEFVSYIAAPDDDDS